MEILIIELLFTKEDDKKAEPSLRDAARTLDGVERGPFSWLELGLDRLEKLVRMMVFLTLPAVAWENKDPFKAFGRSFEINKKHPVEFFTSYTLTGFSALIMAFAMGKARQ